MAVPIHCKSTDCPLLNRYYARIIHSDLANLYGKALEYHMMYTFHMIVLYRKLAKTTDFNVSNNHKIMKQANQSSIAWPFF